jgi:hypothetical protein
MHFRAVFNLLAHDNAYIDRGEGACQESARFASNECDEAGLWSVFCFCLRVLIIEALLALSYR